jgi:uncharacterized protein (DUF1499 family)
MKKSTLIATSALALLAAELVGAQAPGAKSGLLASCPDRSNCVSSDSSDPRHAIAPFKIRVPPAEAWKDLTRIIESSPDTKVVQATSEYLHAEFTTPRLRFTDDVEFLLQPKQNEIAVRSASRLGYYDFGVNRERVESIRAKLREAGVLQ